MLWLPTATDGVRELCEPVGSNMADEETGIEGVVEDGFGLLDAAEVDTTEIGVAIILRSLGAGARNPSTIGEVQSGPALF